MIKLIITVLLTIFIYSGCNKNIDEPSPFNSKNVMRLKVGIHSDMVIKMFGPPKSISVSTCGTDTGSPWTCTLWKYSEYCYISESKCFNFYKENNELYLNDWHIDNISQ